MMDQFVLTKKTSWFANSHYIWTIVVTVAFAGTQHSELTCTRFTNVPQELLKGCIYLRLLQILRYSKYLEKIIKQFSLS